MINEAKKFLQQNPYDVGHDLVHHQNVWRTAQDIARNISIPADLRALKIASFWHDVVTTQIQNRNFKGRDKITLQTAGYLENLMQSLGFESEFIEKVIIPVKTHEIRNKQTTIEARILYDADKLEWLNVQRWKRLLSALKTGRMAKIKLFLYKKIAKRWLKKLRRLYNFDYSRKLHDQRVQIILNSEEARRMAKDLNEDLKKMLVNQ